MQTLFDRKFLSFFEKERILKNVDSLEKARKFLDKLRKCAIFYELEKIANALEASGQSSYVIAVLKGEINHEESMKLLKGIMIEKVEAALSASNQSNLSKLFKEKQETEEEKKFNERIDTLVTFIRIKQPYIQEFLEKTLGIN